MLKFASYKVFTLYPAILHGKAKPVFITLPTSGQGGAGLPCSVPISDTNGFESSIRVFLHP